MTVTNKYRYCNHHHSMTKSQKLVTLGGCTFVADKKLLPLLKALNEAGLVTRTHNYSEKSGYAFLSIILDNQMSFQVKVVHEKDADRTMFNGLTELLILWRQK